MATQGKLILVRIPTATSYRLIPATAVGLDSAGVVIDQPLSYPGYDEFIVPQDACFEFDNDLMNAINNLTQTADHNISAATQLFELESRPATFEVDGATAGATDSPPTYH